MELRLLREIESANG